MKRVGEILGHLINMKILTYIWTTFVPFNQICPGDGDPHIQRTNPEIGINFPGVAIAPFRGDAAFKL